MTNYLESARVLLDNGNLIDSDLALVQVHALIALAESAERIADHLGSSQREGALQVLYGLLDSADATIDRLEDEVDRLRADNDGKPISEADAPRCLGSMVPMSRGGAGQGAVLCALPAEHEGWHQSETGMQWLGGSR